MEEQKKNRLYIDDTGYETIFTRKFKERKPYKKPDDSLVNAFIPGVIFEINVRKGQKIKEGDKLLILEAMKMKNILLAPRDGTIKEILVKKGEMVHKNQLLITLE